MDTVSSKWNKTAQDYSFKLSFPEYEQIISSVKKINCLDIVNGIGFKGFDGSTCKIEISGIGSGISDQVWSPGYKTKERKLQSFEDACKLILLTAKLDPNQIL